MDWPPPEPPPEVDLVRVARLDELRAGRPRIVRVGVKQIALFRVGQRVFATNNSCPHAGGSLGLGRVEGRRVVCPRHEWAFDLETGACPAHEVYKLTTYRVEVRDGGVYVAIPASPW